MKKYNISLIVLLSITCGLFISYPRPSTQVQIAGFSIASLTGKSDNTKIINNYYEAVNAGDWETVFDILDEKAVLHEAETLPFKKTYQGPKEWKDFFTSFFELWKEPHATDVKIWEVGKNEVVVYMRLQATARNTGERIDMPLMEYFTLEEGKITEMWPYYFDTGKAIKVLGLDKKSRIEKLGEEAFQKLSTAWKTGDYSAFTDMLADDVQYQFPAGRFRGMLKGKDTMIKMYGMANQFMQGHQFIVTEIYNITSNNNTVVYELADKVDFNKDLTYQNKLAFSFTFNEDEKIILYREYIGDISPTYIDVFIKENMPKKD